MIKKENFNKSVMAIHDLIIHIKIMTVNNVLHGEMYNFIDDVEYLPQLITSEEDQTNLFEEELRKICEKYSLMAIFNKYSGK
ncbi:GTP-binding protein EngB [Chryseobacterium indologenes]|uniref:GTP-binding protein EngB n=1 Tax=Chryseobacterium indologenes TaxID=253 RepID=UPI003D33F947